MTTTNSRVQRCFFCEAPRLLTGSKGFHIFELLSEHADEWWTSQQVADRLGFNLYTVRRELHRFAADDLIRRRRRTNPNLRTLFAAHVRVVDRSWPPTLTRGFQCCCGEFLANPHDHPIKVVLDAHKRAHMNGAAP